jgi:hypothetical protein
LMEGANGRVAFDGDGFIDCGLQLVDGFDAGDFGDVGFEVAFDADLEGDHAARAADAGAVEADLDFAFGGDVDEFEIAAVCLDGGANEFEHLHDLFGDGG